MLFRRCRFLTNWFDPLSSLSPPSAAHSVHYYQGKISKVWEGPQLQLLDGGDVFEVQFPPKAQEDDKARLLLATLFVNMLFYEAKREGCSCDPCCCCGC